MADEYIGSTVLVTLLSPPQGQVKGIVAHIDGPQLYLVDVTWIASNHHQPHFHVNGENIADIEVLENAQPPTISTTPRHSVTSPTIQSVSIEVSATVLRSREASTVSAQTSRSFLDPAILTTQRPSGLQENGTTLNDGATSLPEYRAELSDTAPARFQLLRQNTRSSTIECLGPAQVLEAKLQISNGHIHEVQDESIIAATLSQPFDDLGLGEAKVGMPDTLGEMVLHRNGGYNGAGPKLKSTKPRRNRNKRENKQFQESTEANALPMSNIPRIRATQLPETPVKILARPHGESKAAPYHGSLDASEDTQRSVLKLPDPTKHESGTNGKRQSKKRDRQSNLQNSGTQEGWGTDNASDIQALGEFDFLGNLSKFDKQTVFNQFKLEDDTADEMRLVGHNRRPRPGTNGGKNLHFTENVLDSPHISHGKWTSEAGETDEDAHRVASGRSSLRAPSRNAAHRQPSRKGSGRAALDADTFSVMAHPSMKNSLHGDIPRALSRTGTMMSHDGGSTSSHLRRGPMSRTGSNAKAHYGRTIYTVKNKEEFPPLTPLQMLELEAYSVSDLGLSEEILLENAGRSIAEAAMQTVPTIGSNKSPDQPTLIVILIGNHKTGARALAAGRHLLNKGFEVHAALLGSCGGDGNEPLEVVRQQLNAFTRAGGHYHYPRRLKAYLSHAKRAPDLLIDAVFGIHASPTELNFEDAVEVQDLALLVRHFRTDVLSVDAPLGLDALTGEAPEWRETAGLQNWSTGVVFLGAPKPWLAMGDRGADGENMIDDGFEPRYWVADVGIGSRAWKRLGVELGDVWSREWVVEVAASEQGFGGC
ncbi:enhancer of mRNA decapping [Agyrium rufum]|nr:enhancer of mRNA decapping [Agyrium rufum]